MLARMRSLTFAAACGASLCIPPAALAESDPCGDLGCVDAETVREIESVVVLPSRARPLEAYGRFYARSVVDGRNVVVGVYVTLHPYPSRAEKNWLWRSVPIEGIERARASAAVHLPVVFDGGCTVINLLFDEERRVFVAHGPDGLEPSSEAWCNGVA